MIPQIIIGDKGQVAKALREAFQSKNFSFIHTSRRPGEGHEDQYLDLLDKSSIQNFFKAFAANYKNTATDVYLAAALTNVEHCESHPDLCNAINVRGVEWVAEECKQYGHRLLFYSSEYVFGDAEYHKGKKGPFTEKDPIAPPCVYGKAKADAEKILLAMNFPVLIIRTTTVFSYDLTNMNFAMQVYRFLSEALTSTDFMRTMNVPVDQISSPTYAMALAEASIELMKKKQIGIFHIVGSDVLSRADFTKRLINFYGFPLEKSLKYFNFLPTEKLQQKAKRPLSAGLKTEMAKKMDIKIWSLDDCFAHMKKLMDKKNGS